MTWAFRRALASETCRSQRTHTNAAVAPDLAFDSLAVSQLAVDSGEQLMTGCLQPCSPTGRRENPLSNGNGGGSLAMGAQRSYRRALNVPQTCRAKMIVIQTERLRWPPLEQPRRLRPSRLFTRKHAHASMLSRRDTGFRRRPAAASVRSHTDPGTLQEIAWARFARNCPGLYLCARICASGREDAGS